MVFPRVLYVTCLAGLGRAWFAHFSFWNWETNGCFVSLVLVFLYVQPEVNWWFRSVFHQNCAQSSKPYHTLNTKNHNLLHIFFFGKFSLPHSHTPWERSRFQKQRSTFARGTNEIVPMARHVGKNHRSRDKCLDVGLVGEIHGDVRCHFEDKKYIFSAICLPSWKLSFWRFI